MPGIAYAADGRKQSIRIYRVSTFDSGDYQWRETYFVFLDPRQRPKLPPLEQRLHAADPRYVIRNPLVDDEGLVQSMTLVSREDNSAIDISFVLGEEVTEQAELLIAEFRPRAADAEEKRQLARLRQFQGRYDILHFEHLPEDFMPSGDPEDLDEMLDPSALLAVIQTLVDLTGGLGIDPQSGEIYAP